ncbi:MAG: hypothetical protein JWQ92_2544 [Amnibacterium sp.]|nr:hypothetical protein [Amnibacterium sp.]
MLPLHPPRPAARPPAPSRSRPSAREWPGHARERQAGHGPQCGCPEPRYGHNRPRPPLEPTYARAGPPSSGRSPRPPPRTPKDKASLQAPQPSRPGPTNTSGRTVSRGGPHGRDDAERQRCDGPVRSGPLACAAAAPIRVASATAVNVGLHAVAVGITPLPATKMFDVPQTRPRTSQTDVPSSTGPIRTVPWSRPRYSTCRRRRTVGRAPRRAARFTVVPRPFTGPRPPKS